MALPRVVNVAHDFLGRVLGPGDLAVDATVGNGHDTRFLAERVGSTGHVVGLDIQADALAETRRRLEMAGLVDRVTLLQASHERLAEHLEAARPGARPRAVVFNLGYRPGGDTTVTTRAESTLRALAAASRIVAGDGLITVVAYPGHPGGREELEAVLGWASSLPPRVATAAIHRWLNHADDSPALLLVSPTGLQGVPSLGG